MKLQPLIKKLKLDFVDSNITNKHFPYKKQKGELKLFHFDRYISTEDAIKEMDSEGYEPVTIHQMLTWAQKEWNGKDSVVALGSVWKHWGGGRRVADLWGDADGRRLLLPWYEGDWGSSCRFAAVRKSPLETGKLGALDPLDGLVLEANGKKYKIVKL